MTALYLLAIPPCLCTKHSAASTSGAEYTYCLACQQRGIVHMTDDQRPSLHAPPQDVKPCYECPTGVLNDGISATVMVIDLQSRSMP